MNNHFWIASILLIVSCNFENKEDLKTSLKNSCNQGVHLDCQKLGVLEYDDGRNERAKFFFEKSCDGKIYLDCHRVGFFELESGNHERALRFFKMACEAGEQEACADITKNKAVLTPSQVESKEPVFASDVEGLKVTEKTEHYLRYKFHDLTFLKGQKLTQLIKYANGDTSCYSIDVDQDLGFHLHGKDGLDSKGSLALKDETIVLSATSTKVNGIEMPKSADTILKLSREYHLSRHSDTNPYFHKGAFTINLDPGRDKKYEFVFTSCKSEEICRSVCL